MSYKKASVADSTIVKESEVDFDGVSIWAGARVEYSKLNEKVSIGNDSIIANCDLAEKTTIGRRNIISHSSLGKGSSTQSNTTIRYSNVGKYCAIAWNVTVGAPNHDMHRLAMAELNYVFDEIEQDPMKSYEDLSCSIGNDVWIAAGAHVLRGVNVSDGAVIAANAVVTKDVPPYAIVAGVPAKIVGFRFEESIRNELMEIKWWDFSEKQLSRARALFAGPVDENILNRLRELRAEACQE